jgi:hypothetical protein
VRKITFVVLIVIATGDKQHNTSLRLSQNGWVRPLVQP